MIKIIIMITILLIRQAIYVLRFPSVYWICIHRYTYLKHQLLFTLAIYLFIYIIFTLVRYTVSFKQPRITNLKLANQLELRANSFKQEKNVGNHFHVNAFISLIEDRSISTKTKQRRTLRVKSAKLRTGRNLLQK